MEYIISENRNNFEGASCSVANINIKRVEEKTENKVEFIYEQNVDAAASTFCSGTYSIFEETGDTSVFDKVIEDLMICIYGAEEDVETIEHIKNLSNKKKRIAILLLLDEHKNSFLWKKLRDTIQNNDVNKLSHLKDVIKMFREYIKIAPIEREKYGEVMTPFDELALPMVNLVPIDFWKNPEHKILDSSAGIGTFLIICADKLMDGLKDWEPNEEKRFKHIVENMLYYGDIKSRNAFLWLCVIDPFNQYKTNTYWGDFFDKNFHNHIENVWKVNKFDLIIGNPPYNKNEVGTGNTLWDKFVIKHIDILNDNKYLLMVHPTTWRKPQSDRSSTKRINNLMMNKQIHYLEMHNTKDGQEMFNAGTRYDFYLLENCKIYKDTIIKDENGVLQNINIKNYDFIANKNIEILDKIMHKNIHEKCEILYSLDYEPRKNIVNDAKTNEFKYTLIHSTPKKGVRYKYTSKNDRGHFGIPKIIFGESGIGNVVIDINGEYGMTHCSMGIKIINILEAENIKKAIMSDKFQKFLESVKWSNFRIDWMLFTYLKKDFWKEFI